MPESPRATGAIQNDDFGPEQHGLLAAARSFCTGQQVAGCLERLSRYATFFEDLIRQNRDAESVNVTQQRRAELLEMLETRRCVVEALHEICTQAQHWCADGVRRHDRQAQAELASSLVEKYGLAAPLAADLIREVTGDPFGDVEARVRVTGLLVRDTGATIRGLPATLTLERLTGDATSSTPKTASSDAKFEEQLFPSVRMAFVYRKPTFVSAEQDALACARGLGWWRHGSTVRWTLTCLGDDDARLPLEIEGDSLGAAFCLGLGKLFVDDVLDRGVAKQLRYLDLVKTAISAAIERDGTTRPVGRMYRKLPRITPSMLDDAPVRTVVISADQPTEHLNLVEEGPGRYRYPPNDLPVIAVSHVHDVLREVPTAPNRYLEVLRGACATIDIRGLKVSSGNATSFAIDDLYIALTTPTRPTGLQHRDQGGSSDETVTERIEAEWREHTPVELRELLGNRLLVVIGDPGSGKTTFLRRIAFELCCIEMNGFDERPEAADWVHGRASFPLFITIDELARHIHASRGKDGAPNTDAAPRWIPHFLAAQAEDRGIELDEAFFHAQLDTGRATVLLDGLDEPPDDATRDTLVKLVEESARVYESSRFVLTSRPAAWQGRSVLGGFGQAEIGPLDDDAIETFLLRWSEQVYSGERAQIDAHFRELRDALRGRPEIRRLARNAVMLTALAVVHWNETKLPEQRADLYESIITWLSESRQYHGKDRPRPDDCVALLQVLALAMHNHPDGRQVQVPRHWAAGQLAAEWPGLEPRQQRKAAERFLEAEELDSGIVVARGDDVRFWHLTFQEYLAARALADDDEQRAMLLKSQDVYDPNWREVVLLLAGVLRTQGTRRADALVSALLDGLGPDASLTRRARCVGLLGGVMRDLGPSQFEPRDGRYHDQVEAVMGIFEPEPSKNVPIEVAIEAADALGQAGDPRFASLWVEANWVEIPAGEFLMGAQSTDRDGDNFDEQAQKRESPVHRVRLDAYRIGRYPVTVAEYARFVQDDGYTTERFWTAGGSGEWSEPGRWPDQQAFPNRPVVYVSWYEAMAYAAWLSERLSSVLNRPVRCSLPTEAQWERGAQGPGGYRRYPWGDEDADDRRMNHATGDPTDFSTWRAKVGHPTPVGVYPLGRTADPERVADMAGNVWEWCCDWRGGYPDSDETVVNPTGPDEGTARVVRGGAWYGPPDDCRAAFRLGFRPDPRGDFYGFRLALDFPS